MKKALSIVLALVMVIGVFPGKFYADKKAEESMTPAQKALEALKGYGAIKGGTGEDPYAPESELTRQDAAVILTRMLGVENDAKATEVKENPFTDLPNNDYYKSIIQYVKEKGIFKGKPDGKFGFGEAITAQQFTTIQLRALGYEVDSEKAFEGALEQAKKLGLLKDVSGLENNTKILRKDVYVIMNNTLETPKKDGKKALKYELGLAQEPAVEKLEVVSAKPYGLKVLKVEFNQPVNERSVASIEILDKDDNDVKFDKKEIVMSEDSKTANLVLAKKAEQNSNYKVTVENVKTADKKTTVEKFTEVINFRDTEAPMIESVEALNPRELVIAVSEPMNVNTSSYKKIKEIKIDDQIVYAKAVDTFNGKVELTLYRALKEGEHKIVIDGLKDYADLTSTLYEQDFTVTDDKEAPAIASAESKTADIIEVTFNENLEKQGKFKVNGEEVKVEQYSARNKKVHVLSLKKDLDLAATKEVKVEYKDQKDIMGNEVKNWEKFTFSVEDDTDVPTAEFKGFDPDDAHKVEIQFSKNMKREGKWTLKNEKGKILQSGEIKKNLADEKLVKYKKEDDEVMYDVLVFELEELKDKDAKDYILVLEKFKDGTVRKNELPKAEISFKGKDTLAPKVVDGGYSISIDPQKDGDMYVYRIAIVFNEKMDESTLKDKSNYTIGATRLDEIKDAKVRVLEEARKVEIVLKAETNTKYGTAPAAVSDNWTGDLKVVKLIGLKDESGMKLGETSLNWKKANKIDSFDKNPEVTMDKDEDQFIKVFFKEDVRIINGDKFYLADGASRLALEDDPEKFSKEFTFKVEKFKFADNLKNKVDFVVDAEAVENARGEKNSKITADTYTDKLPARIALDKDEKKMIQVNSKDPNRIRVTFTEELHSTDALASLSLVNAENNKIVDGVTSKFEKINVGTTESPVNEKRVLVIKLADPMHNGDQYRIEVSVRDKTGEKSPVYTESLSISELEVDAAPVYDGNIGIAADTSTVGKTKVTLPNLDGEDKFRYKQGAVHPTKGKVFDGAGVNDITKNTTTSIDAQAGEYTFVVTTNDNKVISYKIVEVTADKIGANAKQPARIELVEAAATSLDISQKNLYASTPQTGSFADGSKTNFAIEVTKDDTVSAKQTVEIKIEGDTLSGSPVTKSVTLDDLTPKKTEDFTVTANGNLKVTITIKETGKVDQILSPITLKIGA